jgi:hypothetical protein
MHVEHRAPERRAMREVLPHVPGARLLPCTRLIQSSSTLASFNRCTLVSSSGGVNRSTCFERLAQNLCSSSRPPACSEFRLSLRSTQATMSGQKPSKSGFLTAPLRKLFNGSSKRSARRPLLPLPLLHLLSLARLHPQSHRSARTQLRHPTSLSCLCPNHGGPRTARRSLRRCARS